MGDSHSWPGSLTPGSEQGRGLGCSESFPQVWPAGYSGAECPRAAVTPLLGEGEADNGEYSLWAKLGLGTRKHGNTRHNRP